MTFRRPGAAGGPGAVGGRPEREKYGFVYTKPYFCTRRRIQRIQPIHRIDVVNCGSDPPFHTRRGSG